MEEQPTNPKGVKPTNPKDAIGSDKLPLHLWPSTATAYGCLGLLEGMLKYGRSNYRAIGVRASIYYDAARRHLDAWFEGEDNAPDSGLPHLAHALACLAILVEAKVKGNLTDDRMYPTEYRALVESLTPEVKRLKDKYADKAPKHYTIGDGAAGVEGLERISNPDQSALKATTDFIGMTTELVRLLNQGRDEADQLLAQLKGVHE